MSLQVLINGFDVTNGITHRINWVETTGLFDPAALVDPEAVDTFDGPYRVRQTTVDYGMREVSISGILIVAASDYASKLRALDGLQAIYAPRPSRVVVGTLELSVDFGRVQVASDQLKRLNGMIKYTVTGTAIPSTFACTYGAGTGLVQGIPVDTQRVNEAAILATMASGVGTITNPGDVPTPAVLTIQGAASTVYYLATSATGRRVPISTDANGVGRIDERAGLYLAPGVNRLTAYSASTGTATLTTITVMSFFGTTWRYSGNVAAGTATMFDLGPALTLNRTGSARFFRGNTNPALNGTDGIFTANDDEPRIGLAWQNRRNLIVNSLDLRASWTDFSLTVRQSGIPDAFGYEGGGRAGLIASDTTTVNTAYNVYSIGALSAISYVASVYIQKDSNTTRQAGFSINTSTQFSAALLNTATGVAQRSTDSTLTSTVTVSDAGSWWRLSMTWTGDATANNFRLTPAAALINGTVVTATATGSAVFACPQVEIGTTPTAYQATDASGISLDHPVNDAGLVLEGNATNVCLRSQDQNNATWVKTGVTSITTTNTAPDGSATAFEGTSNAADSFCTQTIAGLTNGSTYTFSVWLRTTSGTNTVNIYLSDGGAPLFTACTVTTNWSRFSVTRTIAATTVDVQIGGGSTWSTGEVVQIWGAQLELGAAATSYISTTTVSASRLADVAGLVSPHNMLTYSDTQTNAAWAVTGWSVASTPVAGPVSSLLNAYRVTTTSTSADNLRQAVTIAGGQAGGKVYTFSVWIRQQATTASVVLHIENQAGTSRGNLTATLTSTWQRYLVTGTMASTDTDVIVKIRTANAAGTIDVFGAQLTEGYLPGRYVRTTDTQVLPVLMIDPSWSQNGYIEADMLWPVMSQPPSVAQVIFGTANATLAGSRYISNVTGASGRFSGELWSPTATQRQVTFDDLTLYNSGTARFRLEWTNYTLSGSRFMMLRLYANGVLRAESNFAGIAGNSWASFIPSAFYIGRSTSSRGEQTIMSNLVIGTPSLPDGAIVSGI